eukprot:GHRR01035207.1.p1 GENE.GHRR01035207.1~~GHRR01035207.1.p1  ORF type:complete len:254 (+),score=117.21 GHRR01035207.1:136-897(+)
MSTTDVKGRCAPLMLMLLLQIPLLPPHDKLRKATQDDLDARVNVSPLDLPSCCFFTILNSSSGSGRNGQAAAAAAAAGLTAMTTSRDAKLLAAGFADSSIKLYNMALLGKQRGRLKDKLERRAGREEREAAAAAAKRQKGGGGQQQQQDVMDVDMEEEELQDELEDMSSQAVTRLAGHAGSITGLDFSVDQHLLFSSSTDGTVRLWSTELRRGLAAFRYGAQLLHTSESYCYPRDARTNGASAMCKTAATEVA